jgi:O-antigen/teichoic acid export membrane protein
MRSIAPRRGSIGQTGTVGGSSMGVRFARGLTGQSLLLAAATAIAQFGVAVMYILAARQLQPAEFGVLATVISVGVLAAGMVDFGSNSLWVRDVISGQLSVRELASARNGKFFVAAILAVIALIIASLIAGGGVFVIAIVIFLVTLIEQTNQAVLRACVRSDLVGFTLVVDRLFALGLFCGLVFVVGVPAGSALWIALASGAALGAVVCWYVAPKYVRPAFSLRRPRNPYRNAGYFGLASLASTAQSFDLTIITTASGPAAAGLFGAVNRWTQPIGLLVTAFAQASTPFVAQAGSWAAAWPRVRKAVWMPLVAIASCLVIVAVAPLAVDLLLGEQYEGSVDVLQLLALAVIPAIVAQPTQLFLQALGRERAVALVISVTVALQLVVLAFAASAWGAVGAATVILVGQTVMAMGLVGIALRASRSRARSGGVPA